MKAQKQMKKVIAIACVALGLAAGAAPKVMIDKIENTSVWSTKKVTYTVSGAPDKVGEYLYTLAFDVTAYGVTKNINKGAAQNGTFTETLDTAAIFGESRKDPKAKIRVSVEKSEMKIPPPAGQLWEDGPIFAECNVGATKPEEYGYYFWWGDTVGYKRNAPGDGWISVDGKNASIAFSSDDTTANQTYGHDNAWLTQNGWIGEDGNLVVSDDAAKNRDAARAHLGAPWRMMTKAELDKLVDASYCTRTWVTSYNGKSVNGYVVKGAKDPYKDNEVFFPAAGYGNGSTLDFAGSIGYYWSSSPNSGYSYFAWSINFNSSNFIADSNYRYYGQSVRPVR